MRAKKKIHKVTKTCICGEAFSVWPSADKWGRGVYCSPKCCRENKKRRPIEERFWSFVDKGEYCWVWNGSISNGYGGFTTVNSKRELAHRVSYKLKYGEIKDDLQVLHKCDNKKCVNPDHLFLGTQKDNMVDKVNKNRQSVGENHGLSKLTREQVLEIRRLWKGMNHHDIGKKFGINPGTVMAIVRRETWRHI